MNTFGGTPPLSETVGSLCIYPAATPQVIYQATRGKLDDDSKHKT